MGVEEELRCGHDVGVKVNADAGVVRGIPQAFISTQLHSTPVYTVGGITFSRGTNRKMMKL